MKPYIEPAVVVPKPKMNIQAAYWMRRSLFESNWMLMKLREPKRSPFVLGGLHSAFAKLTDVGDCSALLSRLSKINKDGLFQLLLSFVVGSAFALQTEGLLGAAIPSSLTVHSAPQHRFKGLDKNYSRLPHRKFQRPLNLWEWRYRLYNFELLNVEKPYLPLVL